MSKTDDLLVAFEIHACERIRALLDAGMDVHAPIDGQAPVDRLIEMYYRSDAFPACLHLLLARGAVPTDPAIVPVLLNDPVAIQSAARSDPAWLQHRTTLNCAFTPLQGASSLSDLHRECAVSTFGACADEDSRALLRLAVRQKSIRPFGLCV